MPRRILHDGPAEIILCFAEGSIEWSSRAVIREEKIGLYSAVAANDAHFPLGASYVIVRFAGEELSGSVTRHTNATLFFS